MAKEKKKLTPTQQKKKYKAISQACFWGQFPTVAAPFIAIGIANFNEYFVEYDGVKMSIASVMAAAIMGLAIWLVAKKKFTNTYITLIIGWATFTAIFFLIDKIVYDLKFIMLFGLIGIVGATLLDKAGDKAAAKAEKIQKSIDAGDEERTKNEYLNEVKEKENKKTIKVKVRKDD